MGTVQDLARFVVETRYEDLPPEVVLEAKRYLLDSIGCALAGVSTDKGKIAARLAKRSGSRGESTIIGIGDRVSCSDAAFANGEFICALDFDALTALGHITPFVLAAPLAVAEAYGASGKDLILAVALGHEVSTRLVTALSNMPIIKEGMVAASLIHGYSHCVFGGTAAVAKIMKLDEEKVSHALGISGHMAPVQATQKFGSTVPLAMTKHLAAGWVGQCEITAAFWADMGLNGDTSVFEGDRGYWRYSGSKGWDPQKVSEGLGQEWLFPHSTTFKPYPCCGLIHTGLDCLYRLLDQYELQPDEIEEVTLWNEFFSEDLKAFFNKEMKSHVDAQFSIPYTFSVAAHRVRIGAEWQDLETLRDPRIIAFMDKVNFKAHPRQLEDRSAEPSSRMAKVEIIARGKSFTEERKYPEGMMFRLEAPMTDEELVDKFRHNASRLLPSQKLEKVPAQIFTLEEADRVSELMENAAM